MALQAQQQYLFKTIQSAYQLKELSLATIRIKISLQKYSTISNAEKKFIRPAGEILVVQTFL